MYRKEKDQDELQKKIMIEDVFGLATGGCAFGIEDNRWIVISYTIITSTFTFDLFIIVLRKFVTVVEDWQNKCKSMVFDRQNLNKPIIKKEEEEPKEGPKEDKKRCSKCGHLSMKMERQNVNIVVMYMMAKKEGHCYEYGEWPWIECPYCGDRFSEK